jgi:hypothetical protein
MVIFLAEIVGSVVQGKVAFRRPQTMTSKNIIQILWCSNVYGACKLPKQLSFFSLAQFKICAKI